MHIAIHINISTGGSRRNLKNCLRGDYVNNNTLSAPERQRIFGAGLPTKFCSLPYLQKRGQNLSRSMRRKFLNEVCEGIFKRLYEGLPLLWGTLPDWVKCQSIIL